MTQQKRLIENINELKKQHNAVILAHNYQRADVQQIADFLGDSLDLALKATKTSADVIIFCGVDFMGESAKILNPNKTVILPDKNAACPMAAMVDAESLQALKDKYVDAEVVTYINTSAEVKALSDICCTSSNGVQVVKSRTCEEILFVPDTNLGKYIQRFITNKKMIIWPGICPTHHKITVEELQMLKKHHPSAEILVHPECRPDVIDYADHAFSTNGMVNHVAQSSKTEFIIGTEKGLCHRLKRENPNKKIYEVSSAVCPNMKKITLEKILKSFETLKPQITLSEDILAKAKIPLERMMNIGRGD